MLLGGNITVVAIFLCRHFVATYQLDANFRYKKTTLRWPDVLDLIGAQGRTRTDTVSLPADFETVDG